MLIVARGNLSIHEDEISMRVAHRANLCVKVIDRSRRVAAINGRGLEILGISFSEICQGLWEAVWTEAGGEQAKTLLDRGFAGEAHVFRGYAKLAPHQPERCFEVEGIPLRSEAGTIEHVLVISREISNDSPAERARASLDVFDQRLHDLANEVSLGVSAGRILSKPVEDRVRTRIAESLDGASRRSEEILDDLRRVRDELRALLPD